MGEIPKIAKGREKQKETLRIKKVELKEEESIVPDKIDTVTELPKKGPTEDVNQIEKQIKEPLTKKESTEEYRRQKSKKIDKTVKAEINVESDGTFSKPKLKKSEAVKRAVEGPKMEKVQLKHHEFENEPLSPVEEEKTSIRVSAPLSLSIENIDNQKTKSKTRKIKKKTTPDEVDKSAPDLKTMDWEESHEVEKENRMPNVLSPTGEEVSADSEAKEMESETTSGERISPVLEPNQLSVAKKKVKSVASSSNLVEEVQAVDQGKEFEKKPTQLEKATD